jgi:transcriptional regulator with XRE-family HTH domain
VTRPGDEKRAAERKALGLRLQVLRVQLKHTQTEVANALGVRRNLYAAWESGTSEPGALDVPRLAEVFRVSPGVFTLTDAMPDITPETP